MMISFIDNVIYSFYILDREIRFWYSIIQLIGGLKQVNFGLKCIIQQSG